MVCITISKQNGIEYVGRHTMRIGPMENTECTITDLVS